MSGYKRFKTFASIPRTEENAENAIREWGEWRIMRREWEPKYRYSLFVSNYSLHSPQLKRSIITPQWKRGIMSIDPVSTVANVENNEIRIENNEITGNNLLASFSTRLTLVSHYSEFFSVRGTNAKVLNGLKHSRLSHERRRMQHNVTRRWDEWRIMRGERDPIYRYYRYYPFVSHYSLHSTQWKRGITNKNQIEYAFLFPFTIVMHLWRLEYGYILSKDS